MQSATGSIPRRWIWAVFDSCSQLPIWNLNDSEHHVVVKSKILHKNISNFWNVYKSFEIKAIFRPMSHLSVAGLTHLKISKEFLEHFMPQGDRPLGRLGTESAGLTLTLYYLSKVKQPNLKTISNLAFLYQSKQIQNRYNDFITSFYWHMNSSAYKHPIWRTQDRINPKRKTMCIS